MSENKTNFTREENLGTIGTLKVTKNLQQIIDRLHYKIGATEWSGILFYKLTKGNVDKLNDLEFTAEYFYPMHIGTHSYTEVDLDKDPSLAADTVDAYNTFPEAIEMSRGLLHTHHSMGFTSFSPTDLDELKGNCKLYNYYISLIVDFTKNHTAKIAIPTKTKIISESWFKNTFGKLVPIKRKKEEDVVLIGDLKVIIENDSIIQPWLEDRILALETKKKESFKPVQSSIGFRQGELDFDDNYGRNWYKENGFIDPNTNFKSKIPSYSPKEFNKPASKAKEFLNALIYADVTKKDCNTLEGLNKLAALTDEEITIFEEMLDQNIEIIHENIYNTYSDIQLKKHVLEALLELSEYEEKFCDSIGYEVLTQSLGVYAI